MERTIIIIIFMVQVVISALKLGAQEVSQARETIANNRVAHPFVEQEGLQLAMTHIEALMDPINVSGLERLQRRAERSIHRAQMLAIQTKVATSSNITFLQAAKGSAENANAPIYSFEGEYLITLALGSPPQSFNGIFDTASSPIWRQSTPCLECYQTRNPPFNPFESSTYKMLSSTDALCNTEQDPSPLPPASVCVFSFSYGDGSTTSGILSTDTLTLAGRRIDNFVFGASAYNYGSINTSGADGIIGMGPGALSLPSQMSSRIGSMFSYCLVTWDDAPSRTSPLLLGHSAALRGANVVSTPFVTRSDVKTAFYYLSLQGISFNGKLLPIPQGTFDLQADGSRGFFIDSATTYTMLLNEAYNPLRRAFRAAMKLPRADGSSVGLDLCYNNLANVTVDIPRLTFHFDGADVELPPGNIMVRAQGLLCLAFQASPPSNGVRFSIFGCFQQQNFQILYDKGPANTLSFKPATC